MDAPPPLIPRPVHVRSLPGHCALPPHIAIACQGEHASGIARYLAGFLEALGLHVKVQAASDTAGGSACNRAALPNGARILLAHEPGSVDALAGLPHADEGYELTVSESGVAVAALASHGLFNGVASLLQLLPATAPLDGHIVLDCLHVREPGVLLSHCKPGIPPAQLVAVLAARELQVPSCDGRLFTQRMPDCSSKKQCAVSCCGGCGACACSAGRCPAKLMFPFGRTWQGAPPHESFHFLVQVGGWNVVPRAKLEALPYSFRKRRESWR